ncbi:Type-2Aa cytolytic delta-endotoxin [Streptomyces hundungensis]|uniref:Type-2Aa cytolytic delta-endotoxin n=1 Tax=Streptomyces hundungensis TaxID=1077946 RepID=A0A387HRM4_9ACTN|nr:Type-2Aa cytolytic delta-endotoxin [Streptomyces hundungensis]AYG84490.1 Type-2Aa cytolytic delta-endotoxin [Streptomyces hundungensis]
MVDRAISTRAAFRTVVEVGPDALDRVRATEAALQEAIAPAVGDFDFAAVRSAARALPNSTVVKIIPGFGLQETAPLQVMVLTLKQAVRQALVEPFANPAFWEKADAALAGVFIGLDAQEGAPHLSFQDGTDGTDCTRYFAHLLFALQDEETGPRLCVVAFRVEVTVALDRARLLSLGAEDTAGVTIRLDAISVRQELAPAL